jgi:hypothetical protein
MYAIVCVWGGTVQLAKDVVVVDVYYFVDVELARSEFKRSTRLLLISCVTPCTILCLQPHICIVYTIVQSLYIQLSVVCNCNPLAIRKTHKQHEYDVGI